MGASFFVCVLVWVELALAEAMTSVYDERSIEFKSVVICAC